MQLQWAFSFVFILNHVFRCTSFFIGNNKKPKKIFYPYPNILVAERRYGIIHGDGAENKF